MSKYRFKTREEFIRDGLWDEKCNCPDMWALDGEMKKYLNIKSGFVRNKKGLELNWSLYDWALPLSIDFSSEHLIFIRLFFVSLIIPRK